MFKRLMITVAILVFVCASASAFLDDNSEQQNQGQVQGQVGINDQDQGQQQGQQQGIDSDIDSRNTNMNTNLLGNEQDQGQLQGQDQGQAQGQGQVATGGDAFQAQGQIASQGNKQKTTVEGDNVESYVMVAPDTNARDGQSAMSAYSVFGGINIAESDEYKVCMEKIRMVSQMKAAGLMDEMTALYEAQKAFAQMKDASTPKRILGFGPKTRGRHIFNFFGLIATDSWVDENKVNARIAEKELE